MSDLRYPVGQFEPRVTLNLEERRSMIDTIAAAPDRLRKAIRDLDDTQLDTPYREGGWSVRQVVHHLPDSHMNAFIRLKFALTENVPTIMPYDEDAWSRLPDVVATPITTSITLLESLHERWVCLLRSLQEADFSRAFVHPQHGRVSVDWLVGMYAWHSRHHVAHITSLRERMNW